MYIEKIIADSKKQIVTAEELAYSNMYQLEAMIQINERRQLCYLWVY